MSTTKWCPAAQKDCNEGILSTDNYMQERKCVCWITKRCLPLAILKKLYTIVDLASRVPTILKKKK